LFKRLEEGRKAAPPDILLSNNFNKALFLLLLTNYVDEGFTALALPNLKDALSVHALGGGNWIPAESNK
jgi:microcystin-dependent protein